MRSLRTWVCLLAMLMGNPRILLAQFPQTKKTHPFVNYTEVGALFGRVAYPSATNQFYEQVDNKVSLTVQTFNGVQLHPRLAVGGLIGIDWYAGALMMPVGAGLRYNLARPNQKNINVFLMADAGYGLTWLNKASTGNELTRGGLMINPGIGLRFGKPGKGGFVLSMGYKRQTADAQKPLMANDIRRDEHRIYNRLAVRIGLSF